MKDRPQPLHITEIDISLILQRQQLILMMIEEGKLDPVQGIELYEKQHESKIILEEREAYMNPDSTREDSPLGRLATVYLKTKSDPELARKFQEDTK